MKFRDIEVGSLYYRSHPRGLYDDMVFLVTSKYDGGLFAIKHGGGRFQYRKRELTRHLQQGWIEKIG